MAWREDAHFNKLKVESLLMGEPGDWAEVFPKGVGFGDRYFVDSTNGVDTRTGKSPATAVKSLSAAYALCATNQDDVIYCRGIGAMEEDEMLTWAKNRIHVKGLGIFGATNQRPRLILSTTGISAANSAAVLKVTGHSNSFTNIRINCWGTNAASVTALWDAGENNVYTNCSFAKFSDLNVATVSDVEARGDSTTWDRCKFGFDTLVQSVARPTLWIKGAGSGARMKNNHFIDPHFSCASSESTKYFVSIYDGNSLAFSNTMINPVFNAAVVGSISAAVLDDCCLGHAACTEGNLLLVNPATNCDSICTVLATGIKVVGPLTHVNAGFPQTPA
jgi:hypothetical protein